MLSRIMSRSLAMLLIAALLFPLAAIQMAQARSKTKTFSNTGVVTIPTVGNADPFPSTIQVSGFKKAKIQDVNVTINGYSHEFPQDVGILLQGPNGDTALLMKEAGGPNPGVTNLTITFDDDTATLIPKDAAATSGTFHPTVYDFPSDSTAPYFPLSYFKGGNPNGAWQLFVFDDTGGDGGSISGGWSITIKASIAKDKKHQKKH